MILWLLPSYCAWTFLEIGMPSMPLLHRSAANTLAASFWTNEFVTPQFIVYNEPFWKIQHIFTKQISWEFLLLYFQFFPQHAGFRCAMVNRCQLTPYPCPPGARCEPTDTGNVTCICPDGFTGPACNTDVDECELCELYTILLQKNDKFKRVSVPIHDSINLKIWENVFCNWLS